MKSFSTFLLSAALVAFVLLQQCSPSYAFLPSLRTTSIARHPVAYPTSNTQLFERFSEERKKQLGIVEGDDEYDLGMALENNTDPLISKIIAGSFILVMISLLVVGVVVPLTTDYGEGVCNPIVNAGRC